MQDLIKNLLDSYLAPHAPSFESDPLPFTTNNRHVNIQQEQSTVPSRTFEPVPTAAPARTPTTPEPLPSTEPEPTPRHLIL
jgi:hypothetical protein